MMKRDCDKIRSRDRLTSRLGSADVSDAHPVLGPGYRAIAKVGLMFPTLPFEQPWLSILATPVVPASQSSSVMSGSNPEARLRVDVAQVPYEPSVSLAEAYSGLVQATKARMKACGAQEMPIAEHYAQRASVGDKFRLNAYAWNLFQGNQPTAELRLVQIDGARSNIVNAWIFPKDPRCLPVFAAELIGVADVTRVAFVDVQVPVLEAQRASHVAAATRILAEKFRNLPCDEMAPDWATCQSAGHYTYARAADKPHQAAICACYSDYLDYYLSLVHRGTTPANLANKPQALDELHRYQLHHMEHSPGKKFLGNLFGVDWTEAFMLDFLFSVPQG